MYARKLLLLSAALLLASGGLAAAPPATTFVLDPGYGTRGVATFAWPVANGYAFWRTDVWAVPLAEASQRWVAMARLRIGSQEQGMTNWFEANGTPVGSYNAGAPATPYGPGSWGGLNPAGLMLSWDTSLSFAQSRQLSASDIDFRLLRLVPAGQGSYTFCSGDRFQDVAFNLAAGLAEDVPTAMARDAFGNTVMVGTLHGPTSGEERIGVARILSGCGLDSAFNGNGRQVIDPNPFIAFPPARRARGNTLAFDNAGRLLIGGGVTYGSNIATDNGACIVVRLTASGQRDGSFGNNGVVYLDNPTTGVPGNFRCDVRGLAVQPDGKIVASMDFNLGGDENVSSTWSRRLNDNGSVDAGWNGCCTVPFSNVQSVAGDIARIEPDGVLLQTVNELTRQIDVDDARGTLRPLDAAGNFVDGFLPSPTTSQQLQPSVAYHRVVVESPDAFRVLATSGNDAQTHRLVHIVRYVRASVLAQDRLFANGFDPVP